MAITFDDTEVMGALTRAQSALDLREHRRPLVDLFTDTMSARFEARGRGSWRSSLVRSGRLRRDLTNPGSPGFHQRFERTTFELGTTNPYARYVTGKGKPAPQLLDPHFAPKVGRYLSRSLRSAFNGRRTVHRR